MSLRNVVWTLLGIHFCMKCVRGLSTPGGVGEGGSVYRTVSWCAGAREGHGACWVGAGGGAGINLIYRSIKITVRNHRSYGCRYKNSPCHSCSSSVPSLNDLSIHVHAQHITLISVSDVGAPQITLLCELLPLLYKIKVQPVSWAVDLPVRYLQLISMRLAPLVTSLFFL